MIFNNKKPLPGIIYATPFESKGLLSCFKEQKSYQLGKGLQYTLVTTDGHNIPRLFWVITTGYGPEKATIGLEQVMDRISLSEAVIGGATGALISGTPLGAIAVPKQLIDGTALKKSRYQGCLGDQNSCESPLRDRLVSKIKTEPANKNKKSCFQIIDKPMVTVTYAAINPDLRNRLFELSQAVCVDMETWCYGNVLRDRCCPFGVVRIVSDEFDEVLGVGRSRSSSDIVIKPVRRLTKDEFFLRLRRSGLLSGLIGLSAL